MRSNTEVVIARREHQREVHRQRVGLIRQQESDRWNEENTFQLFSVQANSKETTASSVSMLVKPLPYFYLMLVKLVYTFHWFSYVVIQTVLVQTTSVPNAILKDWSPR